MFFIIITLRFFCSSNGDLSKISVNSCISDALDKKDPALVSQVLFCFQIACLIKSNTTRANPLATSGLDRICIICF